MASYHPPGNHRASNMEDGSDSGYDIERQGQAWSRRSVNSSAFSHLEGRSYRFQPSQDSSNLATSLVPGSFTATSSSIRDETAQLAGMIMSDDEGTGSTVAHGSTISGKRTIRRRPIRNSSLLRALSPEEISVPLPRPSPPMESTRPGRAI